MRLVLIQTIYFLDITQQKSSTKIIKLEKQRYSSIHNLSSLKKWKIVKIAFYTTSSTLKIMHQTFITKNRILPFIQISMSLVYILFWILKLIWGSPAQELVYLSTSFVDFDWFYPLLGVREVALGLLFLNLTWFRKIGFWLFIAHMLWTFLPFITTPELCIGTCEEWLNHPTFTLIGQYIVKNVSLIACGLVLKYTDLSLPLLSNESNK